MISNRETEELIERYCTHQLTAEELRIFEQWLESDPLLFEAVKDHQVVLNAFELIKHRIDLKKQMSVIHDAMEVSNSDFKAPLKVVEKEASVIRKFYRRYRLISIAAAVSIVAVAGTLLTGALTGLFSTRQQGAYQALRLEVERLKRSQKAIISGIRDAKETQEEPEVASGFIGSGLALSSDGYILTSYHVIKDAKKIYISNNKYEQLSVEEVFTDIDLDIAVLKVKEADFKSFGSIPYSFKTALADPGEKVFTLGYPRQEVVYNEGSVSSCSGFEGDTMSYQISIPVNPGNSGGPLFDNQANLVGLISGRNTGAEGASFAIQSQYILDYLKTQQQGNKFSLSTSRNLKGLERPLQIRKLKDFIFMVKVFN